MRNLNILIYTKKEESKEAMICLDADDVSKVIVGKSGIMYEAQQEGKSHSEFMKSFFNELVAKPQVKNSRMFLSASRWMDKIH